MEGGHTGKNCRRKIPKSTKSEHRVHGAWRQKWWETTKQAAYDKFFKICVDATAVGNRLSFSCTILHLLSSFLSIRLPLSWRWRHSVRGTACVRVWIDTFEYCNLTPKMLLNAFFCSFCCAERKWCADKVLKRFLISLSSIMPPLTRTKRTYYNYYHHAITNAGAEHTRRGKKKK